MSVFLLVGLVVEFDDAGWAGYGVDKLQLCVVLEEGLSLAKGDRIEKKPLLIIRDIVYFGKKTYGEFLASEERIATNILANRLAQLEQRGIIVKRPAGPDRRREEYALTEKGLDMVPILVEMAGWSAQHDPQTGAPPDWIALVNAQKPQMIQLIRETVRDGY